MAELRLKEYFDISLGLFRFEVVPEDMIWALELMWVPFLKVNLLLGPVV